MRKMFPALKESEIQRIITDALDLRGFYWCHYRPARTERGWRTPIEGKPGAPDLLATDGERLLLWELKRKEWRSLVSKDQWDWLGALQGVRSVSTRLITPGDIDDALQEIGLHDVVVKRGT